MESKIKEFCTLSEMPIEGFERVVIVNDEETGLKAIICIHNSTLGPALGGLRIYPYMTVAEALTDVQRLARGMTYKSALAEIGLGGGKSVIISHPKNITKEMLISYAEALNQLQGQYICAEDVGSTIEDITFIGQYTPYVTGIAHHKSSGNPSPFTAWGVLRGIQAVCMSLDGTSSLKGKTVAIQGLGSVGSILAEHLFWNGANLILADLDGEKAASAARRYHAKVCSPQAILRQECDILSPCAMGAILNSETIPQLQCRSIAGCANNQLLTPQDALALIDRGILYAPDFVINAGGIINISYEIDEDGYNPNASRNKVDQIHDTINRIFDLSKQNKCSTHEAATSLAEERIKNRIGKRLHPPYYHHFSKPL